jgi:hypothetical protein
MTLEQFIAAHGARPFRPFTLHTADGRSYHVPHPEFVSRSRSGRTIVVADENDASVIVDLLLVTAIDFTPPAAASA